jgi:HlyD family secretion protein
MNVWIKRSLWALLAIAIVAVFVVAMQPKALDVDTATVTDGPFEQIVAEQGETRVIERYSVLAPLAGTMGRIRLKAGDPVVENQEVTSIAPSIPALLDARTQTDTHARILAGRANQSRIAAERDEAKVALQQAQTDLNRLAAMRASGGISQSEYDTADANARSRERALKAAEFASRASAYDVQSLEAQLKLFGLGAGAEASRGQQWPVKSPVAGRVLRVLRDSAGVVTPGTSLIEVADPSELEVAVELLTRDAVQVTAGLPVRLLRWGGTNVLEGRVRRVEPSGYTKVSALGVEEQRVWTVIDITSPVEQWGRLSDGYRVDVEIVLYSEPKGIKAPLGGLFREAEGWRTFVIENGVAVKREVKVNRTGQADALIEPNGGLAAGDRVILHPPQTLKDGTKVRVLGE